MTVYFFSSRKKYTVTNYLPARRAGPLPDASICIPSQEELLGLADSHVVALPRDWCHGEARLHPAAVEALGELRAEAVRAGFDLRVVSGFRSFERQRAIWNQKARGERPVLDAEEKPIDVSRLGAAERVRAILRWSALPGTSRHHWGSDADIYDAAAVDAGYRLQLSVAETCDGGPFSALHRWLDERLAAERCAGFFRPYGGEGCEVAREPWHLSYAPLASRCQRAFERIELCGALRGRGLELWESIEPQLAEICERFVKLPATAYPLRWRAA